jgi:hypothetical protein
MEYRDADISGEDVLLDGNVFSGCTFHDCRIVYEATAPFSLTACSFKENVEWAFSGAASLTLQFLALLYNEAGEAGRNLVEEAFKQIRSGRQRGDAP